MKKILFAVVTVLALVVVSCGPKVNMEALKSGKAQVETTVAELEKKWAEYGPAIEGWIKEAEAVKFDKKKEKEGKAQLEALKTAAASYKDGAAKAVAAYKEYGAKLGELEKTANEPKADVASIIKEVSQINTMDSTMKASATQALGGYDALKKQAEDFLAAYKAPAKK